MPGKRSETYTILNSRSRCMTGRLRRASFVFLSAWTRLTGARCACPCAPRHRAVRRPPHELAARNGVTSIAFSSVRCPRVLGHGSRRPVLATRRPPVQLRHAMRRDITDHPALRSSSTSQRRLDATWEMTAAKSVSPTTSACARPPRRQPTPDQRQVREADRPPRRGFRRAGWQPAVRRHRERQPAGNTSKQRSLAACKLSLSRAQTRTRAGDWQTLQTRGKHRLQIL